METPIFYSTLACSKPTLVFSIRAGSHNRKIAHNYRSNLNNLRIQCDFLKLHFFRISEHSVVYFNIAEKNFNFLSVNFPFGTAKGGWRISAPMIREKFHSVLFRPNSDKEVYSTHTYTYKNKHSNRVQQSQHSAQVLVHLEWGKQILFFVILKSQKYDNKFKFSSIFGF